MVLKMKILSFESAAHSRVMELTIAWVPQLLPLTSSRNFTPEDGLVCQYPAPHLGLTFPVSTSEERKDGGREVCPGGRWEKRNPIYGKVSSQEAPEGLTPQFTQRYCLLLPS